MSEAVKLILSLSVSGGLFALALIALKPLIRNRLSKSFGYYIWLVVLLRFMLPLTLGINLMDYASGILETPPSVEITPMPESNPGSPVYNDPALDNPVEYTLPVGAKGHPSGAFLDLTPKLLDVLPWLWLAGAVFSALRGLYKYNAFVRGVQNAAVTADSPDCKAKVLRSSATPTPVLIGVFKPKIILPDISYTDEQLHNILLHELTHLRRHDILLKWIVTLCVTMHWFNPIVYLMRREINQACELSCDEAVIRCLDNAAKQSYGDTLISVVAESRIPAGVMSVTMCEEKKKLKERLVAIMKYRKRTKLAVLITAVLAVVITGGALAFGAQSGNFAFWKSSVYSIDFPYEKTSDISTGDVTRLIKETVKNTGGNIYLCNSSYSDRLNPDFTFMDATFDVMISETGLDGYPVYRLYQIRIFGEDHKMNIYPFDGFTPSDMKAAPFDTYWNALSNLPEAALAETLERPAPDFYSISPRFGDWHNNSSPNLDFIFYNESGLLNAYGGSPSIILEFTPMYEDFTAPGKGENYTRSFTGIGTTYLYYYVTPDAEVDSPATPDEIASRPVIDGSIFADLTQEEQKISAAKLSAYRFYTNSEQITVSIPNGEYSGIFYLYDAENPLSSIMEFALDQDNRTNSFTGLTSAKEYYLSASGIDDSVLVTVSD